jgi:hypothetical protein
MRPAAARRAGTVIVSRIGMMVPLKIVAEV